MISRDEYLKKHWIPYPTARQGHDCGRWLNCKRSKALLKTLDGPISALDILVDGDWVSVDPVTHEVTLLAPQWEALPSPQGLHTQEAWAKFLRTTRHFFEEELNRILIFLTPSFAKVNNVENFFYRRVPSCT